MALTVDGHSGQRLCVGSGCCTGGGNRSITRSQQMQSKIQNLPSHVEDMRGCKGDVNSIGHHLIESCAEEGQALQRTPTDKPKNIRTITRNIECKTYLIG